MTPPKSILDPAFEYVNAANTDIRKRFTKVLQEQADARREQQRRAFNVKPILERKA